MTSSPQGSTVHEHQQVYIAATLSDPAGNADPLTVTINWGPGPNAIEVLNLNSGDNLQVYHDYALATNADQTITITVTVDDGDGAIETTSFSLTYDDVISNLFGQGDGAVDGVINFGMHAEVEAGTGARTISDYQVDVDHDGIFDDGMFVDGFTWDPNNVVLNEVDGLALLGSPSSSASFTAQFRVTTSDGVFQDQDIGITIINAEASSSAINDPSLSATSTSIDANTTVKFEANVLMGDAQFFVLNTNRNSKKESASGIISLSPAQLGGAFNKPLFKLQHGVDFRAKVTRPPAAFANTPYFIQYVENRTTTTINGVTTTNITNFRLDNPKNDVAGRAQYYGTQSMFAGISTMNDVAGLAIDLLPKPKSKQLDAYPSFQVLSRFDPATGGQQYKMLRTIADELSVNDTHTADFLQGLTLDWNFQTYVVVDQGGVLVPRGRLEWEFRVTATASGYDVVIVAAPAYVVGDDPLVWNL